MSRLSIDTDWMEICVADRPEIEHTYAQLSISVGEHPVTLAHHRNSSTMSKTILVSLYPLAEWIVGNWWLLTEETELPGREGFLDRHGLNRGRGGYCMPDLRFIPEGENIRLEWAPYCYAHAPVDFISQGTQRLPGEEVKQVLWDFVDSVDQRLVAFQIMDTWMQKEWSGIQNTLEDAEETEFCRAAAWLGLDAYELADGRADELVSEFKQIPQCLREDALRASVEPDVSEIGRWIGEALSQSHPPSNGGTNQKLEGLRLSMRGNSRVRPWERGYKLAGAVTRACGMSGTEPGGLERIVGDEGLHIASVSAAPRTVDGLCFLNGRPVCHTAKKRPDSQRFVIARALYDYLITDVEYSLLTLAKTERQQEGRAFAAELLAPADALRKRIHREVVAEDEALELATEFNVSYVVIERQISNHKIAKVY